jgi:hypothetical protein
MGKLPFRYDADNAGHIPAEGDYVAYNYSGQIATGYVRHIGRSKSGSPTGRFTIHQVLPTEGHISRIKGGPKCLLVLDKGSDA